MFFILVASVSLARIVSSVQLISPSFLQWNEETKKNESLVLSNVATIVAMDMRMPEDYTARQSRVDAINKHTEGTDVYFCTDRNSAGDMEGFEHVVVTDFVDDVPELIKQHWFWHKGTQWWRFGRCYSALTQFAAKHQHEYSFIFKTRLDLAINLRVVDIARHSLQNSVVRTAFTASDYIFGGPPAVMSILAKLYDELSNYLNPYSGCPFNSQEVELLLASDWSAARFDWLNFPREALADICNLSVEYVGDAFPYYQSNLRSMLLANQASLVSSQGVSCDFINVFEGWYGENEEATNRFESERAMVRHLLRHGVLIKEIEGVNVSMIRDVEATPGPHKKSQATIYKWRVNQMLNRSHEYCRGRGVVSNLGLYNHREKKEEMRTKFGR